MVYKDCISTLNKKENSKSCIYKLIIDAFIRYIISVSKSMFWLIAWETYLFSEFNPNNNFHTNLITGKYPTRDDLGNHTQSSFVFDTSNMPKIIMIFSLTICHNLWTKTHNCSITSICIITISHRVIDFHLRRPNIFETSEKMKTNS